MRGSTTAQREIPAQRSARAAAPRFWGLRGRHKTNRTESNAEDKPSRVGGVRQSDRQFEVAADHRPPEIFHSSLTLTNFIRASSLSLFHFSPEGVATA